MNRPPPRSTLFPYTTLFRSTVTGLRLDSNWASAPGVWLTSSPGTGHWGLEEQTSELESGVNVVWRLLVEITEADGGSFVVFAADYLGSEFLPGRTLTLTVTFSDGSTSTASTTVPATVTVTSAVPSQGAAGATVPVTINGSGFASGATVSAGAGITVSNVSIVSATQITATFAIGAASAVGPRDITVTNQNGGASTFAGGFMVTSNSPAALTLAYNGKVRDRVGQGEGALGPDGALDATLTATLSASGGRTVTGLRLDSNWASAPGVWLTSSPGTGHWVLAAAPTVDGAVLNASGTLAVNFPVADGGSFVVFAADYLGSEFLPGRTLTLTVTFSDGSTSTASTTVPATVTVTSAVPNQGAAGATVPVTINGSGFASGATVSAGAGITVSNVSIVSATQITATFAIGAASALGPRDITVTNQNGGASTFAGGFTVTSNSPAALTLAYNGKVRDRVGQ